MPRMRRETTTKRGRRGVSRKIAKLRSEGVPERQAVATSLNMRRAGRLAPSGRYLRVGGRRRSKGRR